MKKGFFPLMALGMMATIAPISMTIHNQPMMVDDYRITSRYTGKRKSFSRTGRRIGGGAWIVLNQRQKRKRWRQSPHKRPVRNIH